jgi:ribosome-interacting GTPase 1
LIVLDPLKGVEQKLKILHELHAMGIRINKQKPDIYIERKKTGGVNFTSTCRLTQLDEHMVKVILQEYKINNADVVFRGDYNVDDLIDAIEGNRKYVDSIFVYNKIDLVSIEDIDELARRPNSVVISVNLKLNLEFLLKNIWEKLNLIRIYTKKRGAEPGFDDPIILTLSRKGCSIEAVCEMVHKDFAKDFKYGLVWGRSAKFSPQTCGLSRLIRPRTL